MSVPNYPLNHPSAQKRWSPQLFKQMLKSCYASRFFGTGKDSLIQVFSDLQKNPGDKITISLRKLLSGAGVAGDGVLEGAEESMNFYTDSFIVDQLRHAVRTGGRISEQRVSWSSRDEARDGLADWWADRIDTSFFNQLAGNTGETDVRYTGLQAPAAPTAAYLAGSDVATTASLSITHTFKLEYLDYLLERAKTRDYPMRPLGGSGAGANYVCFITEQQRTDLMVDAGTNQWADLTKNARERSVSNPIFSGADIVYRGVIVHSTTRLPRTNVSGSVYANRAVFCGAQAGAAAFCRGNGPTTFSWEEQKFDYSNQLGVAAGSLFGMKKTQFESTDYAVLTMTTAGQDHG